MGTHLVSKQVGSLWAPLPSLTARSTSIRRIQIRRWESSTRAGTALPIIYGVSGGWRTALPGFIVLPPYRLRHRKPIVYHYSFYCRFEPVWVASTLLCHSCLHFRCPADGLVLRLTLRGSVGVSLTDLPDTPQRRNRLWLKSLKPMCVDRTRGNN